jgi:hypothetical protein
LNVLAAKAQRVSVYVPTAERPVSPTDSSLTTLGCSSALPQPPAPPFSAQWLAACEVLGLATAFSAPPHASREPLGSAALPPSSPEARGPAAAFFSLPLASREMLGPATAFSPHPKATTIAVSFS